LDYAGSSSRASCWKLFKSRAVEAPALPGCLACHSWQSPPDPLNTDHPWSNSRSPCPWPHHSSKVPSLVVSRPPWPPLSQYCASTQFNDHPWSPPAFPLHYETGYPLRLQLLPFYSSNGNAVVYLLLRKTKLVFTWWTALQGIMCSRSNLSYARMLLHTTFK